MRSSLKTIFSAFLVWTLCVPSVPVQSLNSVTGGMMIPAEWFAWYKQPQNQNMLIDAASEAVAFVFQVPKSGNIHKVGFRTGSAVTVSDTLKVGLYTVLTTSGVPSTVNYGGSTDGTQASLVANTTYTVTLTADAAAVIGDKVALVIQYNSYVAGNLNIAGTSGAGIAQHVVMPYTVTRLSGASWTKQTTVPTFWIEYDDGSYAYIPHSNPWGTITSNSFNSGSTPDEYALTFSIPFPARLSGVAAFTPAAPANMNIKFYDVSGGSTTTLLNVSSATVNPSSTNSVITIFTATNTVNIYANQTYRVSLQPTDTVTNAIVYTVTFPSATAMNQMAGGTAFYLSTATNGGAFGDVTNQRPLMSLILDQFSNGESATGSAQ